MAHARRRRGWGGPLALALAAMAVLLSGWFVWRAQQAAPPGPAGSNVAEQPAEPPEVTGEERRALEGLLRQKNTKP